MTKASRKRVAPGYLPPEMRPFAFCMAVIAVVLDQNEKARKQYEKILQCWSLPGCLEIFGDLEKRVPKGAKLVSAIVKEAGYDLNQRPEEKNQMIHARGLLGGWKSLAQKIQKKHRPWGICGTKRKRDFTKLAAAIDDFIAIGFNNEADLKAGKPKINGNNSGTLGMALFFRILADEKEAELDKVRRAKAFRKGNKIYDVESMVNRDMPERVQRELVGQYKKAGFRLVHADKLNDIAWRSGN